MMQDGQHYISKEKLDELQKELTFLKTVRRKEIAEALEFAKSLGDLSENAEYQEAREDQATAEDRIMKIEAILKNVVIVKEHHTTSVELGSHIVVKKEGDKESQKLTIVGSEEADIAEHKISNESPLGRALLGKKKGDTAIVVTPKGKISYTVIEIE